MAQQYITTAGALIIPGAYPSVTVQASTSGISTTGVIALVGEADAGPDYTLEADINANSFGPDQLSNVIAKYKSGNLVDAFRGAATPANDTLIQGAPSKFILVKTNPSTKASSLLTKVAGGTYGILDDQSYGALGNLIYFSVAQKTAETLPTTGAFTFLSPIASLNMTVRVNGGAEIPYTAAALQTPAAFQAGLQAASAALTVTGGADRATINAIAGTLAAAASGNVVTFTVSTSWNVIPTPGDMLFVSSTSVVKGGSSQNSGSYVVTSATSTTIVATKLMDQAGSPGALTPPVTVGAVSIASTTADLRCFAPVVITQSSAALVDGLGKSIEINELTSGTDRLSNCCYSLNASKVTWVSKVGAATQLTSGSEYAVTLNVNRQVDNISEAWSAGGQIALQLGYTGTSCSVTVAIVNGLTMLTTTVVGGAGANLSLNLAQYATLNDLVAFLNTQPGYTASVGLASLGQLASIALDEGTYTAGTTFGNQTMRLKVDAVKFFTALSNSTTIQLNLPPTAALAGLPAVTTGNVFLGSNTVGAKGGTSQAIFQSAVDSLQAAKCNFVVPLFSRNATLDIAAGTTDSSSTYTIDSINSYMVTHCNALSTVKRRRNRQAFCSKRDTFLTLQTSAANLAAARVAMFFQDVKDNGANGIQQFQPWMAAAKAAGMQAAGFYKAIVNKGINISGAVQAAGDYLPLLDSNQETALLSGLCPIKPGDNGGFKFVSDQTTYLRDSNFVYNSIQAIYAADVVALTTAQRMEQAIVGQSVADISATVALSALQSIMNDMLRLKLIAPSSDTPSGYRNAKVTISGPTMIVSIEIKLAGAIYFIPINFQVTQVTQSAS